MIKFWISILPHIDIKKEGIIETIINNFCIDNNIEIKI